MELSTVSFAIRHFLTRFRTAAGCCCNTNWTAADTWWRLLQALWATGVKMQVRMTGQIIY